MSKRTIATIAVMAFLLPIGIVAFQHRDSLLEMSEVDATRGHLLFFTSPG